jgi:hypothetical protein
MYFSSKVVSPFADAVLRGEATIHEQYRPISPSSKGTRSYKTDSPISPNGKRTHPNKKNLPSTPDSQANTNNGPEPSPEVHSRDQRIRPGAFGRVWLSRNQVPFHGNLQLPINWIKTKTERPSEIHRGFCPIERIRPCRQINQGRKLFPSDAGGRADLRERQSPQRVSNAIQRNGVPGGYCRLIVCPNRRIGSG